MRCFAKFLKLIAPRSIIEAIPDVVGLSFLVFMFLLAWCGL